MEKAQVLDAVRKEITAIPGIIAFQYLDAEFKDKLIAVERDAESHGACGGLMPFTNEGVWKTFEREVQFVIVASSETVLLGISNGLVFIKDQKGQTVGEWLTPERQTELKGRTGLCYISDDFVLYPDVKVSGEPFFVLREIDFPFLRGFKGVKNVTSGSISTRWLTTSSASASATRRRSTGRISSASTWTAPLERYASDSLGSNSCGLEDMPSLSGFVSGRCFLTFETISSSFSWVQVIPRTTPVTTSTMLPLVAMSSSLGRTSLVFTPMRAKSSKSTGAWQTMIAGRSTLRRMSLAL